MLEAYTTASALLSSITQNHIRFVTHHSCVVVSPLYEPYKTSEVCNAIKFLPLRAVAGHALLAES